jgi:DNA-binding transcriptional LysR family regulator
LLRLQQEALESVEKYGGKLVGRMKIGAGTIPGTYILPHIIGRFRKQYSSIKATLRIAGSQLVAAEVLNGELDMAVVGARWREKGLAWTQTFSDRLVLVVNAAHPWASRSEVSLEELLEEPFIFRERASGTRSVIDQIFQKHGINSVNMHEVAEIGSTAAIKEAVKAGIGISILSVRSVEQDVKFGLLKIIPISGIQLERPFYFIKRSNRELSPVSTVFWEYLRQEGSSDQPAIAS